MGRQAQMAVLVIAAAILLLLPFLIYFRASLPLERWFPSPTPTPRLVPATASSIRPVVRTATEVLVVYWLYGNVVSIETEVAKGMPIRFALAGDPFKTSLAIQILSDDGKYKLLRYDTAFGGTYKLQLVDGITLKKTLEGSTLVELRLPFLKRDISSKDQVFMSALESANSGNWQNVPQTSFSVDSVGVMAVQ